MSRGSGTPAARERGATLVEYALAVALIVAVSLGAVEAIQDRGGDHLDESGDRVGVSGDNAFYSGGGSPSPTPPPPPPPPPPPSGTSLVIASATASPPPSQGSPSSKWIAYASLVIRDDLGNPISGVTVTGQWTGQPGQPVVSSCTTTTAGQCSPSPQLTGINDNVTQVTFTVTSMSKDGFTWTSSASDAPPVVVDCTTVSGIC